MHFDKRGGVAGGGGGGENKRIKGICLSFRCGCQSVFHGTMMVCCTRTAINYGYFIATR